MTNDSKFVAQVGTELPPHMKKREMKNVKQSFQEKWMSCNPDEFKQKNKLSTCDGFFDEFPERLIYFSTKVILKKFELIGAMDVSPDA